MTFTTYDLNEAISAVSESENYDGYNNPLMDLYYGEVSELKTSLGRVTKVESGPEDPGDGKAIYIVIKVDDGDRLFRAWGYYSSWDSSQIDGELEEVELYEKTVTDYRRV